MLEILIIVLFLCWLLGVWVVPSAAIHLILVVLLVVVLIRVIQGRR